MFGDNLIARCEYTNINSFGVDITAEALSVDEWLNKTYYACKPLFNPATEDMADIRPTTLDYGLVPILIIIYCRQLSYWMLGTIYISSILMTSLMVKFYLSTSLKSWFY